MTVGVVIEDALGGAVEIVELAGAHRPKEGAKPGQAEEQRRRYEDEEAVHGVRARPSRIALAITISDDVDMAMAARSGVTKPATASGTAARL